MPFIIPENRKKMDYLNPYTWITRDDNDKVQVGDRCYYFYNKMVKEFKESRRWTTAHNIYKKMKEDLRDKLMYSEDTKIAYQLAWQVFFNLYVMKYENEKWNENGDI